MTRKPIQMLMVAATMAAFAGCQSGPSWAWWKHDKAADASAIAKSNEPALPSAQSSPQAVAVAGLTPAAPPSSTNLAATTGEAAAAPNLSLPGTFPAAASNPQIPPYSPANSLADKLTSSPNITSKPAAAALSSVKPLAAQPS